MPRPRSWTDDQLRNAVATSSTYREVSIRLGLTPTGNHVGIRVRIAELGIDDSHLQRAHRAQRATQQRERRGVRSAKADSRRRWSDDDLREAVAAATSLNQVFANLGLSVGGAQWLAVKERILDLDVDTSHFATGVLAPKGARPGRERSWTDDDLRRAVDGAVSLAEVLRRLGLSPRGGSRTRVKRRIAELRLDTSAMRGQAWARGQLKPGGGRPARPLEEILVANSDHRDTNRLRERLIREGVFRARCATCGGTEWRGQPMPLRLDHINGDRRDNRLENLRLLCANCDAQTDTYCGRNIGRNDRR